MKFAEPVTVFTDTENDQYLPFTTNQVERVRNRAVIRIKIFVFARMSHWSKKMYYKRKLKGLSIFNKGSNFTFEKLKTDDSRRD